MNAALIYQTERLITKPARGVHGSPPALELGVASAATVEPGFVPLLSRLLSGRRHNSLEVRRTYGWGKRGMPVGSACGRLLLT